MTTHSVLSITTRSTEETHGLGKQIGRQLISGSVIAFIGDLGSGKTTLIQGLAQGLEVPEEFHITSPTYTLINEYPGRLALFHVDLYRLEGPDDFEDIGLYDILDGRGVVAIEWADKLEQNVLSDHICIQSKIQGETIRNYDISAYGKGEAILEKIKHA